MIVLLGMFLLVVSAVSWLLLVMTKGVGDIRKALVTAMIGLISSFALLCYWQVYIFSKFMELYL